MAKRIEQGDTEYDTIRTSWISEGRPDMFDRQGSWGGALYWVHGTGDYPTFFQTHSAASTTYDDSSGNVTKGWDMLNVDGYMKLRIRSRETPHGTKYKVTYKDAPNNLEPEDTVA